MNKTHFGHAIGAFIMQIILWPLTGLRIAAIIVSTFFIAREYSQMEGKCYRHTGRPVSEMMPWHCIRREYMSLDSFLDWIFPTVVVFGTYGIIKLFS